MRMSIAAALVAASAATSACNHADGHGGPTVSRNYQVGNFQQIEVAGPYDVTIRTGANPGVSAQGSQKLLERTVVVVQGDKLVIHPEEKHGIHFFSFTRGKADFTVTVSRDRGTSTSTMRRATVSTAPWPAPARSTSTGSTSAH